MKINAIKSNYDAPVFNANNKPENKKNSMSGISGTKLAYGIAGLAAIGIATFAILKGKKPSGKVINEAATTAEENIKGASKAADNIVNSSDIVKVIPEEEAQPVIGQTAKELKASVITKTEVKPFSHKGIGETEPFEGVEKLIYTDNKDGTGRTYQRFYNKDRLYEYNIYDEILGETPSTKKVTRYNLAYENGRIVGVAKQDVFKDGLQHGEYKDNGFDTFPIMVKMKGDKDFQDAKVYTSDALFELDERFSPYNL